MRFFPNSYNDFRGARWELRVSLDLLLETTYRKEDLIKVRYRFGSRMNFIPYNTVISICPPLELWTQNENR